MGTPIPEPSSSIPFLGHIREIDFSSTLSSFLRLADIYGEIFRLRLAGRSLVFLSTHELVNEACDEKRFTKRATVPVLLQLRNVANNGLFTAENDEPEWGIAHRILMPAFGPLAIRNMFPEMQELASQLALKWARFGPQNPIVASEDFTRLTLDTISLCAMDYRFNSFYQDKLHPFLDAMVDVLVESGHRSIRPKLINVLLRSADNKYWKDIDLMRRVAREVIEHRKENPKDSKDLLSAMLDGVDPKTGKKMSEENVIDNLITFLIAGHETTSGLLSFSFYELIKHPDAYQKAQEEIDRVVGTGPLKPDHLPQLSYLAAVFREVLRLHSPIGTFIVCPIKEETLARKYNVNPDDSIFLLLARSHLDPKVYGDDVLEFKPERMLDDEFDRRNKEYPSCWKPFGNGMRACIGRPFAWQEALIVTAILLQNFNFVLDEPSYQLRIKQTLTIKPEDFRIRAILRGGLTPTQLERRLGGAEPSHAPNGVNGVNGVNGLDRTRNQAQGTKIPKGKPMSVFFGSNSGTCEAMAHRLAADAPGHGFYAKNVNALDAAKENIPKDHPVVFITASYEGQPPDNASHFVKWIERVKDEELLKGVCYATFGVGHHDWSRTFHRIPKLLDSTAENLGAERICQTGLADAAGGDVFTDFESWEDEVFWPAVVNKYKTVIEASADSELLQSNISVHVSTPRSDTLKQDVKTASIVDTKIITAPGEPVKRHIEIKFPEDQSYISGDYLAVLPLNPPENVDRALRCFQLPRDAHIEISNNVASGSESSALLLPINTPMAAHDLLAAYVELGQPATKRNILALAAVANKDSSKKALQELAAASTVARPEKLKRHNYSPSVLDLLEAYSDVKLSLGAFLTMLPSMRIRQYSISSSPLWDPHRVTLTYSVLQPEEDKNGNTSLSNGSHPSSRPRHIGVASSYLASLSVGDALHAVVRQPVAAFRLPRDVGATPMLMVCAGTGIAPFRAFVQERAALSAAGRTLAPAVLYHGCRQRGHDDLYANELEGRWLGAGRAVTVVRRAYSRDPEASNGCKYVQDLLWRHKDEVCKLWEDGAKVYICGGREMGETARDATVRILMGEDGVKASEDAVRSWYESMRNVRFVTDVF